MTDMCICPRCKGKGDEWYPNGPDDYFHDICSLCDGTGLIEQDKGAQDDS